MQHERPPAPELRGEDEREDEMFVQPLFRDRREAGRVLAKEVGPIVKHRNALVLALPRGGVPVGFEVAQALDADLDIFLVRKLGVPGREELAMGAIAISAELTDRVTAQE